MYGQKRIIYTDFKKGSDLFIVKRNYDQPTQSTTDLNILANKFANDSTPPLYQDDNCTATKLESGLSISVDPRPSLSDSIKDENQILAKLNQSVSLLVDKLGLKNFTLSEQKGQKPKVLITLASEVDSLSKKMEELKVSEREEEDDSQSKLEEVKERMYLMEMGFAVVAQEMIKQSQQRRLPFIGHNCMYDLIYFYN
jgi:hypothetical protein